MDQMGGDVRAAAPAETAGFGRRTLLRPPLVVALLLSLVVLAVRWPSVDALSSEGRDLLQDHLAAETLADGDDPAAYEPFTIEQVEEAGGEPGLASPQNVHPITATALYAPLTALPFTDAAVWWSALSVALFASAWWALTRELGVGWLAWLLPVFSWWFPLELHLRFGQWSIVVFALVVGAWMALRRGRDGVAGVAIGLAVLVKVFPALLLVVPLARRRLAAVWWAAGAAAAGLAAVAVWRPSSTWAYLSTVVADHAGDPNVAFGNASVGGLAAKLFEGGSLILPVVDAPALVPFAAFVGLTGVLACAGYVLWASDDLDLQCSAVIVAMLLVSPVTWVHAWVLLLLPFLVLAVRPTVHRAPCLVVSLVVVAVLTQVDHWRLMDRLRASYDGEPFAAWTNFASPGVVVLVALLAIVVVVARRERRSTVAAEAVPAEATA